MDEIAILGVGMHPWGKWGRNFTDYGVHAARAALEDADLDWREVGFISGAITVRCGYPGYVAGSTFARALGFTGAQVASSYSACASGHPRAGAFAPALWMRGGSGPTRGRPPWQPPWTTRVGLPG